ncbi:MAG: hypothetical protein ACI9TV_002523 [Sulfurimonas sp.]|jgi:hypothetical protein|uniref:hypothetical protein n=1 Tax=Sulfurimonas sp. TaxID=2022749 RepID=UPI0039E4F9BA
MQLKYVGPKPIISHTGIDFDNNKEDKFAYLNISVQLLKALSHDYFEDRVYKYNADTSRFENDELIHELKKYCPTLDALMDASNHNIEEEIQHNIQRAHDSNTLEKVDKDTLANNINIMHDYIVQRSINKSVYYCTVESLAKLLQKDNIDYVIAPMFQKFAHVLHSVQGVLLKKEFSIDTKIEIYQEDGKLLVKLEVINT